MHELKVERLVKRYGSVAAVDHVNLTVEPGELLVLLGPSGCGKTTLLRAIAGLETAEEGLIALGGATVFDGARNYNQPTYKRDIGMVFQNYSLWPHMTVAKNVAYPLAARGVPKQRRDKRVEEALRTVQCDHLSERLPAMLSGGQQQRIALARALAPQPAVMLLDEPLSNLDALLRVELRTQLRAIHQQLGFTGIYVTHDQIEAFNLGTRVAVMRAGQVEQLGAPADVYLKPATEYVAKFLGIRNALPISYADGWVSPAGPVKGAVGLTPGDSGATLMLYVRPESVMLSPPDPARLEDDRLSLGHGVILDTLFGGGEVDYVIKANEAVMYAKSAGPVTAFRAGDRVHLSCNIGDALIYKNDRLHSRQAAAPAMKN